MNSARSRRLQGSIGDSWGDADYESDEGASIRSASDISSDAGSESDWGNDKEYAHEHQDIATPLPNRVTRGSSRTPQDAPVKTPANRAGSRHSQSPRTTPRSQPRSVQSTPGTDPLEPSFIMPSMAGSTHSFYNGSPMRNSQMRVRKASHTGSVSSSPRISSRRTSTQMHHQHPDTDQGPWHYINLFRDHVLWPLLQYVFSVVAYAADFAKPILAMGFAAWLFLFAIGQTSGLIQATVETALFPLCIIPGSSYILPFCAYSPQEPNRPDFEELVNVQSTFEDILYASQDSYALPATMKKSEGAIRDLRSVVKYSKLPSRAELEVEFNAFIETAKEASADLTKYNMKIGYTMDQVISTNGWTMRVLEGIAEKEASHGSLSRFTSHFNPFSVFMAAPATLEQQIFDQYLLHVSKNKEDISSLIQSSHALLALLTNLENRLDIIAELAVRDGVIVNKSRDELLSQLWSKLGGNRSSKKGYEEALALLSHVMKYKNVAVDHVSATLLKLQEISAGLENLREGVAAPEVLGWRDEVPLSWHLSVIGKAVERLKDARGESRHLEMETIRKGLGEDKGEKGLPGVNGNMPTVYAKPHA